MSEREKLKKLAEAATAGPWESGVFQDKKKLGFKVLQIIAPNGLPPADLAIANLIPQMRENQAENAKYIAAANPSTILALLAQLEQAETQRNSICQERDAEFSAIKKLFGIVEEVIDGEVTYDLPADPESIQCSTLAECLTHVSRWITDADTKAASSEAALRTLRQASAKVDEQAYKALMASGHVTGCRFAGCTCGSTDTFIEERLEYLRQRPNLAAALAAEGGK